MQFTKQSNRREHQPSFEIPEYTLVSNEQLELTFKNTAALIMAYETATTPLKVMFEDPKADPITCTGEGTSSKSQSPSTKQEEGTPRPLQLYENEPLIAHAVKLVLQSCIKDVTILVADTPTGQLVAEAAQTAALEDARAQNAHIQTATISAAQINKDAQRTCYFEIADVPQTVLAHAQRILDNNPQVDYVLLLNNDQVRIRPQHLMSLRQCALENPECDVVVSWITWLRRTPILITRQLFKTVETQRLMQPRQQSTWRPLPQLNVQDVVFGEEKLAANFPTPPAFEKFCATRSLSALEALNLAKAAHNQDEKTAAQAKKAIKALNSADTLLVKIAKRTISRLEARIPANSAFAADVAWAQKWGMRVKADFPIFQTAAHKNKLAYLDSAATAQRLGSAIDAQARFDAYENANIYRGVYGLSSHATASYNEARSAVEHFIGADRREVIFTQNSSTALSLVAQSWGTHNIHEGDLIICALSEHHSNLMPWMILSQRTGAKLAYIPILPDGSLDMSTYEKLLQRKPKLVCVAQISNVLGIENPIQEMAKAAHKVGARICVDAAQSAPHISINVKELGCDFLAFSGHKLYGPLGVGCLWISPEAFDECDPITAGGGTISHVSKNSYYLRGQAIQYELGTPPIAQVQGLAQATQYLELLGMDNVARHSQVLSDYLMWGLRDMKGITVWGNHETQSGKFGLVSVSLAGVEASRAGAVLASVGVDVRTGGHCALPLSASMGMTGTIRLSLGIYNTADDIEAALVALELASIMFGVTSAPGENLPN